ncbi:Spermidine/putrescine ABC transporter permease [Candidatus Desulfarcum epimagneticum]|uniref:Spermidine/putrescine ABC transporter permease n=1 Tax=uncultured Desulfobacteraceae bacterium TaxID=218296 RepID=A0A484HQR3_9BACT|nr:Spermidine/putrescine ABC transporter permease [uncultured Desulfobacteraceae bacterium]
MKKIFTENFFLKWITVAVYIFIFAPILVVILMSFHPHEIVSFPMPGFSLKWYVKFISNHNLLNSLRVSLLLGVTSALMAGVIGTLAAFAIVRSKVPVAKLLNAATFAPMVISGVVLGVAMLSFFNAIHFPRGFVSLAAAHTLFSLPYVIIVVSSSLAGFDRSTEEAAMNLGANAFQTFKSITLPAIFPAIVAGMLLSFTISFDEFPASQFLSTPGTITVPIRIFSMIKTELNPQINVLAAVMILVTICLPLMAQFFMRGKNKK